MGWKGKKRRNPDDSWEEGVRMVTFNICSDDLTVDAGTEKTLKGGIELMHMPMTIHWLVTSIDNPVPWRERIKEMIPSVLQGKEDVTFQSQSIRRYINT